MKTRKIYFSISERMRCGDYNHQSSPYQTLPMKTMAGASRRAVLNRSRTRDAATPSNISTNSEPFVLMNGSPDSPAIALARKVFPVPGGPSINIPCTKLKSAWRKIFFSIANVTPFLTERTGRHTQILWKKDEKKQESTPILCSRVMLIHCFARVAQDCTALVCNVHTIDCTSKLYSPKDPVILLESFTLRYLACLACHLLQPGPCFVEFLLLTSLLTKALGLSKGAHSYEIKCLQVNIRKNTHLDYSEHNTYSLS